MELVVGALLTITVTIASPSVPTLQDSSNDIFYANATAKARGEASFAVEQILCTMRNRIAAGWSQHNVLDAYYAPLVYGSDGLWMAQVEMAREIFEGRWPCDKRLCFALGTWDTWQPHGGNPVLVVYRDMSQPAKGHVRFYAMTDD